MKSYNPFGRLSLQAVALALLGMTALPAPAQADEQQNKPAFADVPPTHWAYNAVQRLATAGIIEGYPLNSERQVSQTVTRVYVRAEVKSAPEAIASAQLSLDLTENPAFSGAHIHISMAHSVLTLTGTVKNQYQKTLAEQTLKKNDPSVQVVNQLKVISTSSR